MPAKDKCHNAVKNALRKDGWTITRYPYTIRYQERAVQIDLLVERLLLAEKATQKIAVEIKTFRLNSKWRHWRMR